MRDLIDLRAITGVYQAPFWISLEDLASRWTAMFAFSSGTCTSAGMVLEFKISTMADHL